MCDSHAGPDVQPLRVSDHRPRRGVVGALFLLRELCQARWRERTARSPGRTRVNARRRTMAPSRILLMRHAEKPDDPGDPDLTEAGRARAAALARYIPATFGKP